MPFWARYERKWERCRKGSGEEKGIGGFQAANTLAYSKEDLVELAKESNQAKPIALSIADMFGAICHEDLERVVDASLCGMGRGAGKVTMQIRFVTESIFDCKAYF